VASKVERKDADKKRSLPNALQRSKFALCIDLFTKAQGGQLGRLFLWIKDICLEDQVDRDLHDVYTAILGATEECIW